jgi:preprotein translocase subunit SecG
MGPDSSSADAPPPAPAGWYVNPSGLGQRYWDGEAWTDSFSGAGPPPPESSVEARPVAGTSGHMGLIIAGYVLAVIFPIAGFILGIVAATRPQKDVSKHGVWIVVVSVLVIALDLVVILHSGRSTGSMSLRL